MRATLSGITAPVSPRPTIIEALHDPKGLGASFPDLSSWASWLVVLKAVYGLPLDPGEVEVFKQHTGRSHSTASSTSSRACAAAGSPR
jgi:hypothetical protein